jgi:uncharacterized protein
VNLAEKTPGPKKLLALDGGGIRGALSIEILAEIEAMLREARNAGKDFVLADYFDYMSGTSTGGVIAACLSWGMSVDKVRNFYEQNGRAMFDKAFLLKRFRYRYEDNALAELLKSELSEDDGTPALLGTHRLKTLFMLVMRNATTDSPWTVSNNPRAKYNDLARANCNLKIPLWQLVRASTAAPVYFPPEVVAIGEHRFTFVDGGITMYNNPAFQMFLMATLKPYNLCWPTGEDKMLIVSVGTGTSSDANADLAPTDMNLLYNAGKIPSALMYAALNEQDFLCRVFGRCRSGHALDREVGDLCDVQGPVEPKLFSYMRYNAELTLEGLAALGLSDIEPENVQQLDSVEYVADLQRVGRAVGAEYVKIDHFKGFV